MLFLFFKNINIYLFINVHKDFFLACMHVCVAPVLHMAVSLDVGAGTESRSSVRTASAPIQ